VLENAIVVGASGDISSVECLNCSILSNITIGIVGGGVCTGTFTQNSFIGNTMTLNEGATITVMGNVFTVTGQGAGGIIKHGAGVGTSATTDTGNGYDNGGGQLLFEGAVGVTMLALA
jgi:hypothetical protein